MRLNNLFAAYYGHASIPQPIARLLKRASEVGLSITRAQKVLNRHFNLRDDALALASLLIRKAPHGFETRKSFLETLFSDSPVQCLSGPKSRYDKDSLPPYFNLALRDTFLGLKGAVRPYRPADYDTIWAASSVLREHYDQHDEARRLLDQLVGREAGDEDGLHTLWKVVLVAEDKTGRLQAAICMTLKRGGSVKVDPLITITPDHKEHTVLLTDTSYRILREIGVRKAYCTVPRVNRTLRALLTHRYSAKLEGKLREHFKPGFEQWIYGMLLTDVKEVSGIAHSAFWSNGEKQDTGRVVVSPYESRHVGFFRMIYQKYYAQWHDDLDENFLRGIVVAHQRGFAHNMDFQMKSTRVLIAESNNTPVGMAMLVPKRGGPTKLYPFTGTEAAHKALMTQARAITAEHGGRKIYTFCHQHDTAQIRFLESIGFVQAGLITSPYKAGHNLVPMDFLL